jgi:hypothetical protein
LARKKHLHEAEAVLREVLATSHDLETQINLAQLLEQQDRRDEALAMLESTIARNPSEPKAYCNLGVFLLGTAKIDGAEAAFKQALRLNPDMALARWNLSFCYLSRGDYARGWEFYETRYSPDMPRRLFPLPQIPDAPLWRGESLARAHILVVHEQGYGDQIQSLRFLPLLASRGGQITVSLPQPLIELASSMGSQYRFVSAIPNERFDFYVPLMSLPGRLQVELEDLPGPMPYLHADPAYVAGNGLLLDSIGSGLKVGLVWAGNPGHPNDRHRSVPIKTLEFLLPVPGVVWFALDKAVASDQVLNGQTIHALGHRCSSFADTAALVEAMDLIISVDTAVAHLAGALGKECWLLLPFAPDWRWLLERDDSPWYPSLRLFRQQQHARWEPVFERVRSELVQLVRSRQARDAGELHPEAA